MKKVTFCLLSVSLISGCSVLHGNTNAGARSSGTSVAGIPQYDAYSAL